MPDQMFHLSSVLAAAAVLMWSLSSTPAAAQEGEGAGGRQGLVAGCPRPSQQFYPCARAKAQAFHPRRTSDGRPDMQGAWIPLATGSQNIENYPGDTFFGPASTLIVDPADGRVPYRPEWVAKRQENLKQYLDPLGACYPPGIPRHVYGPRGHHILQSPGIFAFASEFAHVYRVIPTDESPHIGNSIRLYMGDSRGRWEGNTLVVDTTNLTDRTWLDIVGDFHSADLHVIERFTLVGPDTILYETTLDDPKIFAQPWTMVVPLARMEKGHEVMEEACFEGDHDIPRILGQGWKIYLGLDSSK